MATPQFDSVLGRVPSGIFILTAGSGDRATGMLASWVMQAGFEPPMVSVAVKKERYLADWISEGQPFVLNLVGEDQAIFLKHFGKGFEPNEPAFEGRCHTLLPYRRACLGRCARLFGMRTRQSYRLGRSPYFSRPHRARRLDRRRKADGSYP